MRELQESDAIIAIVDDDPSARKGLERLIRSAGWKTETFASAQAFLDRPGTEAPSCLVLDSQLPATRSTPSARAIFFQKMRPARL